MEDKTTKPMWDIIRHLAKAPDGQLDKSMADEINNIVDEFEGKDNCNKEVADKLLYVLDMCVHASLASGFVIKILDAEWRRLGGTIEDGNVNCPWRNNF
jgi:hypothetical protein